jgi:hypothetical protein
MRNYDNFFYLYTIRRKEQEMKTKSGITGVAVAAFLTAVAMLILSPD